MSVMKPNAAPREDVVSRFVIAQNGTPSEGELDLQRDLAETFVNLADVVNVTVADSREKSLALTHLEEALIWTGKAIFKKDAG